MNYPFDTVGLDGNTIDTFYETYKALQAKFNLELTGYIDFHLADFEVFRQYEEVIVRDSYVIKGGHSDCYVLFVEVTYKVMGIKSRIYHSREYQTWALSYLKKDFGRALIRPETLTDKILEIIHPVELDFSDDKAFSDTFYVLVNDRQKAELAMDRSFRNVVMDVRERDFVIEVISHTLIIGTRQPVLPENSVHFAEFVIRACSNC